MNNGITDKTASRFLGQKVLGSQEYDSTLITPVPRAENRILYGINDKDLPFLGWDIWHAYEFSCLTNSGIPVTRVLKLRYPCESEYIVESKSLKLYLNSFNMTRFGKNISECLDICKNIISTDLSEKLKTNVEVAFLDNFSPKSHIFSDYKNLMELVNEQDIIIDSFKESPELLEAEVTDNKIEYKLTFDSLRSNCRVTHQPDFGDVFINYESSKHIKEISLIKYLCSFRSEYHFHEECCEMIFKRLSDILDAGDKLFVCALYTRRGGIDICPVRMNLNSDEWKNLGDITQYARYGIKQ